MENKTLHLFDLDYTLWKLDEKLAVIDKRDPKNIIFRIPSDEQSFMKEYYKNYGFEVSYNGYTWYLNENLYNKIKSSKKGIELENIGISYREFTCDEILEKQIFKTDYLLENLKHLKNDRNIEVGYISARLDKNGLKKNIDTLTEKVERILHTKINKKYFVNNIDNNMDSDITSVRKAKIILEFLTGFKIKGNRFVDLKQSVYDNVNFYDDDTKNIEGVLNLQFMLEKYLLKSEISIKKQILERIKNNKIYYTTNLVTQNSIEPFITKEQQLLLPNYIKLFEQF